MIPTGPFYKSVTFWLGLAVLLLIIRVIFWTPDTLNYYVVTSCIAMLGVVEGILIASYVWYKHTMDMIEMWEERITILKAELARSDDPQLIKSLENLAQWENDG